MSGGGILSQQESRRVMLDLLSAFADVCGECGAPYYLGGGTLLGAVRHKGFIPWDDDIDVFLRHEDYPRVLEALKSQTRHANLSVVDNSTEGYYLPFAKIVDDRTVVKIKSVRTPPHGIWVDVFPLNNVPADERERKAFAARCRFLRTVIISMKTDFAATRWIGKAAAKRVLAAVARAVGKGRVACMAERYMSRYNARETGCVCITWTPYGSEYMETEKTAHTAEYEFEERFYTSFADYDTYLRRAYGDYMKLPPAGKRRGHVVTAWWKEGEPSGRADGTPLDGSKV